MEARVAESCLRNILIERRKCGATDRTVRRGPNGKHRRLVGKVFTKRRNSSAVGISTGDAAMFHRERVFHTMNQELFRVAALWLNIDSPAPLWGRGRGGDVKQLRGLSLVGQTLETAWEVLMESSFPNSEKLQAGELAARSFSTSNDILGF